jgi:hypothetical protein
MLYNSPASSQIEHVQVLILVHDQSFHIFGDLVLSGF